MMSFASSSFVVLRAFSQDSFYSKKTSFSYQLNRLGAQVCAYVFVKCRYSIVPFQEIYVLLLLLMVLQVLVLRQTFFVRVLLRYKLQSTQGTRF